MAGAVNPVVSGLSPLNHFSRSHSRFTLHSCRTLLSTRGGGGAAFVTAHNSASLFFRSSSSHGFRRRKPLSPVMEWQDCSSEIEVDVPCSVAYECYLDREAIPHWMPFISSVKILEDNPDLSRWSLKYEVFGQDIELSWLARNFQPIRNQKIHWRSLEGLPNRGAVRFFPKGPSSCRLELTVSYEVPQILSPVSSALKPFLQGLLLRGLEQFAAFARNQHRKIPRGELGNNL